MSDQNRHLSDTAAPVTETEVAETAVPAGKRRRLRGPLAAAAFGFAGLAYAFQGNKVDDLNRVVRLLSPLGQDDREALDTTLRVQDQIHDKFAEQGGMTPAQAEALAPQFGVEDPKDLLVVVNQDMPAVPLDPEQSTAHALAAVGVGGVGVALLGAGVLGVARRARFQ